MTAQKCLVFIFTFRVQNGPMCITQMGHACEKDLKLLIFVLQLLYIQEIEMQFRPTHKYE